LATITLPYLHKSTPMTLTDLTLMRSSIPLKKPFVTNIRRVNSIIELVLILETDEEVEGLGSAPSIEAITGETLEQIEYELREIAWPALEGHTLNNYEATFALLGQLGLGVGARTALDMALHDLYAKQANLPLYAYLGGTPRALSTLYTISVDTPSSMVVQALDATQRGFDRLKIKLDSDHAQNIARLEALHAALPHAHWTLDANQALDVPTTLALIEATQSMNITLLEQPVAANDWAGMRTLTAQSAVPIMADETLKSLIDVRRAIEEKTCHIVNLKLFKCGGIYEARKILALCQAHAMPVMIGSMLEGALSVTAALHLAYGYSCVEYLDVDGPMLGVRNSYDGGITYEGNAVTLTEGIGLGVGF